MNMKKSHSQTTARALAMLAGLFATSVWADAFTWKGASGTYIIFR